MSFGLQNTGGFVLGPPVTVLNIRLRSSRRTGYWKSDSTVSDWITGGTSLSKITFHRNARRAASKMNNVKCQATNEDPNPLKSQDFLTRIRAINDHRRRMADEVIEALVPIASTDEHPQIRYSAISQLAGINRRELHADHKRLLLSTAVGILKNDADSSCQSAAADVIAALGLVDGFETLVNTYEQTADWMLKVTIAAGMGEIGHPGAYDFLKKSIGGASTSGDELLLATLIGALGDVRNPEGMAIAESYLNHPDIAIRQRARIAVELIKGP